MDEIIIIECDLRENTFRKNSLVQKVHFLKIQASYVEMEINVLPSKMAEKWAKANN